MAKLDPEAALWQHLHSAMGGLWEAQRHEDRLQADIPDVSYSTTHHGWIELKVADKPKRPSTPVRVDHFTAGQRNWLTRHGRRGGKCFILLQVGPAYFLFSWTSARVIGDLTLEGLAKEALAIWGNGILPGAFLDALEGVTPQGRT